MLPKLRISGMPEGRGGRRRGEKSRAKERKEWMGKTVYNCTHRSLLQVIGIHEKVIMRR